MHTYVFFASIPAGVLLILSAHRAAARTSAAIYAASVLLVFGTSAGYHRLARGRRAHAVMQRLDHAMIFVLIAGTYVPVCIVVLPLSWGIPILSVVGAGCLAGITMKLAATNRLRWAEHTLYPVLGWAAIIAAPVLIHRLGPGQAALLLGGGLAYTFGFPVIVLERPNPWPRTFGYHEIWHVFTVIAAACHFALVASVVA